MFRKMRRGQQQLSEEECIAVLQNEPRGVLALHGEDGYPYALPMNQLYFEGKLYFHCAKEGHKIDALAADSRASLCVMDRGFREEGDWALHIKSVIIFGKIEKVTDRDKALKVLRQLGLKYYPTAESVEEEIRKGFERVQLLELTIDHMTGKLVKES